MTPSLRARGLFSAALVVVMAAGIAGGSSCTKAGRSVLRAKIEVDSALASVQRVQLIVAATGGTVLRRVDFAWTATKNGNEFGVYLDAGIEGPVTVYANGYGPIGTGTDGVSSRMTVQVTPGEETSVVPLVIAPGVPDAPPGGGNGSGGAAGGAAGGRGGNTGAAGGGPATGGSNSGGGGSAGAPVIGGTAGQAGRGGNGAGVGGAAGAGIGGVAGSGTARSWRTATRPDPASLLNDTVPGVAVDDQGNVVVVYVHGGGIYSSRNLAATGSWGSPAPVDGRSGGVASSPSVAVDKNGKWLAVWQQANDNTLHGIWQSTSADGVAWAAPTPITASAGAYNPILRMNRDGVAVAAWNETIDNKVTASASVRASNAWSVPRVLRPGPDNGDRFVAAAVSSKGEAFVAWEQTDGGVADKDSVWLARFAGGAWGTATLLESYDGGLSYSPEIAANAAGQVIFTWIQSTTTTAELWVRRLGADGTLAAAFRVAEASDISWAPAPSVTLDDAGTATVAMALEVRNKNNTYAVRGPWSATTWPAPVALETDNDAADDRMDLYEWATYPNVGSDAAGNVVLTWRKRTGPRFDMYAARLAANGTAWGTPTLLETRDTAGVALPVTAVGANGVAVAAWVYFAEFEVWANLFR